MDKANVCNQKTSSLLFQWGVATDSHLLPSKHALISSCIAADSTPRPHHIYQSALPSDFLMRSSTLFPSSWHVHTHVSQPLCLHLQNICFVTLMSCFLILSVLFTLKEKFNVLIAAPPHQLITVPLPTTGDYRSKSWWAAGWRKAEDMICGL